MSDLRSGTVAGTSRGCHPGRRELWGERPPARVRGIRDTGRRWRRAVAVCVAFCTLLELAELLYVAGVWRG